LFATPSFFQQRAAAKNELAWCVENADKAPHAGWFANPKRFGGWCMIAAIIEPQRTFVMVTPNLVRKKLLGMTAA